MTSITAGLAYRYDVKASEVNGDPLTYALTQSPAGMTIDPVTGRIAWSPGIPNIGSYAVNVAVTDNRISPAITTNQLYTLTVLADTAAPVMTMPADQNPAAIGSLIQPKLAFSRLGVTIDETRVVHIRADSEGTVPRDDTRWIARGSAEAVAWSSI